MTARWLAVALVYLAGVAAAGLLGQIAPVAGQVRTDLTLSLVELGWAISAVTAVAAVLGAPGGWWVRWRGGRRALTTGLVILGIAGVTSAASQGLWSLVGARVVAGAGYLLVVVAGPVLVAQLTDDRRRSGALSLWGACIPAGLAVSAIAGGMLGSAFGWRPWLVASSVLPAILAPAVLAAISPDRVAAPAVEVRSARLANHVPALLLSAGFCGLSLIGVSLLALLPTYLIDVGGMRIASAGSATGAVALASIPGSLAAAWLLRRGRSARRLSATAMLMPVAALLIFNAGLPLTGVLGAAGVLLFGNGLIIAVMFAAVPMLVADQADLALANGLVAQFGSVGALVGPPLFGVAVSAAGWPALVPVIAGLTVAGATLLLVADARRPARLGDGGRRDSRPLG